MKIAHIVLSGVYTEGMSYQENMLPLQNARDGNDVIIVASCQKWEEDRIVSADEGMIRTEGGIRLYRVPFDMMVLGFLAEKIRKSSGLMKIMTEFHPDIIFMHDLQSFEIKNLAKYKRDNSGTLFLVDSHADAYNSSKNFLSRCVLHKGVYRSWLAASMDAIDRVFYINQAGREFIERMYRCDKDKMEFFPLAGDVIPRDKKEIEQIRKDLGADDDTVLMFHTGKIGREKRTKELLEIFSEYSSSSFKLAIIGKIDESYKREMGNRLTDANVAYLGWMEGREMVRYLSAGDVYVQPGSASATLQAAICSGNAVIAAGRDRYEGIIDGNGWIIEDPAELRRIFSLIVEDPSILKMMKEKSSEIAERRLNYRIHAARMYELWNRMKG
jgi:glycosyltransferase involved in cell wall biosynthesis